MSSNATECRNFVIAGTEKAGTTSVFDYLSAHPQVCASSRKETDFFRNGVTGDASADADRYAQYFKRRGDGVSVLMEASPGYLGEASLVVPRMHSLLPQVKLLFILRDPVDRLYSSYHFHRGKLNLPQSMSFDDYVRCCLDFDRQAKSAMQLGLDEWYLKVLRFGRYAEFLAVYGAAFPAGNIKVMFFESLRDDVQGFMRELSEFLGINPGFWSAYEFRKSNVTFAGRNRGLHFLAMRTNALAEPVLRRFPAVKQSLVRGYKAINQQREGYDPMPATVRARLVDYYAPSIAALREGFGVSLPDSWAYLGGGGAGQ